MSDTVWLRSDTRTLTRRKQWRPTLKQLFVTTVAALMIALGALFVLLLNGSQRAIMETASHLRDQAARELALRVKAHLATADDAQRDIETQFKIGLLDRANLDAVEIALVARLAHHAAISELTLTYAPPAGRDSDGQLRFLPEGHWQISVFRESAEAAGSEAVVTRRVLEEQKRYVAKSRRYSVASLHAPWVREADSPLDPIEQLTFKTPVNADFYGKPLWSDLHWSDLDEQKPISQRRVTVSLQKALRDNTGQFSGVLRVGLLAGQLDAITQVQLAPAGETDPHRVMVCDRQGRLISRLKPGDPFEEAGDDLRARVDSLPLELRTALESPELQAMDRVASARFEANGEKYLATFRALDDSQDWVVGIVVPESAYLKDLAAARNRLLLSSVAVMVLILAGGAWTLGVVRRDLNVALEQTTRIGDFEFAASTQHAHIADLDTILDGLERSKTSMRAICKYVPKELVRLLHEARAEPILGSEPRELTLMFTDLKDFTAVSEQLPPNKLAEILGFYLQTMTEAIHSTRGTVDKYIGDAVMAFWNAPAAEAEHSRQACEAALRCVEATERLFASAQWAGMPPLVTRFGIHRSNVMVGHFGSPDRLNYTAIGDGVNAAARLEGLNKEYGTVILVSEAVCQETRMHFDFRLLDEVAVKGKQQSLRVYELLGRTGEAVHCREVVESYDAAFALYRDGNFSRAIELLRCHESDAPSRALRLRCEKYLSEKPTREWNGVFRATVK